MVICQLCFKKCSVSSSKERKKRELFKQYPTHHERITILQMLTVCVIMSLSIYLYHKRIHKNLMLWVACWIWSCLSFKILEITECSLMIYIVPRRRRHCDTVRIHVEIIRKRCEEFHSKTLDIQIQHKIKSLPEVYHPVCEKSTGSMFCFFFVVVLFVFVVFCLFFSSGVVWVGVEVGRGSLTFWTKTLHVWQLIKYCYYQKIWNA